jgi:hypothetical protein
MFVKSRIRQSNSFYALDETHFCRQTGFFNLMATLFIKGKETVPFNRISTSVWQCDGTTGEYRPENTHNVVRGVVNVSV